MPPKGPPGIAVGKVRSLFGGNSHITDVVTLASSPAPYRANMRPSLLSDEEAAAASKQRSTSLPGHDVEQGSSQFQLLARQQHIRQSNSMPGHDAVVTLEVPGKKKAPAPAKRRAPPKKKPSIIQSKYVTMGTEFLVTDVKSAEKANKVMVVTSHGEEDRQLDASQLDELGEGSALVNAKSTIQSTRVQSMQGFPRQGVWFLPTDMDSVEHSGMRRLITGHSMEGYYVRPLVLFAKLMRAPVWLRDNFSLMDERMSIKLQWGYSSRLEQALLWITNQDQVATNQDIVVWYSNRVYGPGEEFQLFGANGRGEVTDKPYIAAFLISTDKEALGQLCEKWDQDFVEGGFIPVDQATKSRPTAADVVDWVRHITRPGSTPYVQPKYKMIDNPKVNIVKLIEVHNSHCIKLLLYSGLFSDVFADPRVATAIENLALKKNDARLVMLLITMTRYELSYKALRFLIHAWSLQLQKDKLQPDARTLDIEYFLVTYIRRRRRPLSSTAAIMGSIINEIESFEGARRFLEVYYDRFHSLSLALLDEVLAQEFDLRGVHKMLQASEHVSASSIYQPSINDVGPLNVAFYTEDLDFTSHDLLFTYMRNSWQGRRFLSLTSSPDRRAISVRNPQLFYRIFKMMGFGGGPVSTLQRFGLETLHIATFASAAFFNSPRGRWTVYAMCEVVFLVLYELMILFPGASWMPQIFGIFFSFVIGNVTSSMHFVMLKYGDLTKINNFLKDPWEILNTFTNIVLFVLCTFLLVEYAKNDPPTMADRTGWLHMCLSTTGVFVWLRALKVVIPVYPSLGPLLTTVSKMMAEVVAFVFPYIVVSSGFASLLTGVFTGIIHGYATWAESMLSLFQAMLGQFDFNVFMVDLNGDPVPSYLSIFGRVVLLIYLVLVAILMLNLLVAIIITRYKPEATMAQTQFGRATILDAFIIQVEHNLTCSPLNLIHYLLFWIPNYKRHLKRSHLTRILLLVNPDGELLPEMIKSAENLSPTGRGEFPHFAFLLTGYPMLLAIAALSYLVCGPVAIMMFALKQSSAFTKRVFRPVKVQPSEPKLLESPSMNGEVDVNDVYGKDEKEAQHITGVDAKARKHEGHGALVKYLVQLPAMAVCLLIGILGYFLFLGSIFFSMAAITWAWKLLFSLWHIFVYPWLRIVNDNALIEFRRKTVVDWRAKWQWATNKILDDLRVGRLIDQSAVDRALGRSLFDPFLADWGIKVPGRKEPGALNATVDGGAHALSPHEMLRPTEVQPGKIDANDWQASGWRPATVAKRDPRFMY